MKCSYPLCMLIWQCRSLKQQWLSVEFLIHTISKVLRKYWPRFHTALFIKWENFELFRVQNVLKCKCHGFEGLFSICELLWVIQIHGCRLQSEYFCYCLGSNLSQFHKNLSQLLCSIAGMFKKPWLNWHCEIISISQFFLWIIRYSMT